MQALLLATALSASIPAEAAKRVFDEARIASADDGGSLWGRPLFGPMFVVDPKTRFFVRSDGASGELPSDIVPANTATKVDGVLTTMVLWPAITGPATERRSLLMHECWHRIQNDLGFPAGNPSNPHLDTVEGRVWLLLELRALAAALRAADGARDAAISDAVAFRNARRAVFPGSSDLEHALENNEGLAEYTGFTLRGATAEENRLALARRLDRVDRKTSFVRAFAYHTGPAYGLLLDAITPGWTRKYKPGDDLAARLAAVAKVGTFRDARKRALAYGGLALRASEEQRDREQRARVATFRVRLVEGPLLELPMADAHFGFDPNTVVAIGDAGSAYPSLDVSAAWGRIVVDDGARITTDWSKIIVPRPIARS